MKLLSLDPLAGWSGDGSVLSGSLVLGLSGLCALRVSCTELWGCRVWKIRYGSAVFPTLQSHVLLRACEAVLPGEPGEGLLDLRLGSGELGKAEYVRGGRLGTASRWGGGVQGEGGEGFSHAAALQLRAGEPSAEGSWEGRGCCIAGLRLEAVRMEMCLCQGGCDTEEQCPARPLISSPFL